MKILVASLNWGLGHASRCVPLIARLCSEGHEVVIGGDGDALTYLQQHFPHLRSIELAQLNLRYSAGKRQVLAMMVAIPKLIAFSLRDHRLLQQLQSVEHFDQVISDNRFGLYLSARRAVFQCNGLSAKRSFSEAVSIYITHQLHIMLPRPYKWLEPLASRLHAYIYNRYSEVWVPDTPDHRLTGELSTLNFKLVGFSQLSTSPKGVNSKLKFIGPLSRFSSFNFQLLNEKTSFNYKLSTFNFYKVVALFSGLEPHRSLFEQEILERFKGREHEVLMMNGKLDKQLSDSELAYYLTHAETIICRSGYSTIMDLDALGVLDRAELIPTPGQPEQEYLAKRFANIKKK